MTSPPVDVLGIGNAIVDVLVRVDEPFLARMNLVKGAMQLVDELEAERLYSKVGPAVEISGGSAANTIAGVASFGGSARYVGKVRNDQLGRVFSHDIRAAGVAFDTEPATGGPATARCLVLVTPDGERTMNTFLGASSHLSPDDIRIDQVEAARIVYLEGYLWDPPLAMAAFSKAAQIARAMGRRVALSLSDAFCVDRHRESFLALIRSDVDILFANEAEIRSLYQVDDFDRALAAARHDCPIAVLTRSASGSVVASGDEVHAVPAEPVGQVVDVTGAGDLYAAGFLFGLTRGRPLPECAKLGALAAAEIISHIGARPQAPLADLMRS